MCSRYYCATTICIQVQYHILWGYPPPTNSEIIICSFSRLCPSQIRFRVSRPRGWLSFRGLPSTTGFPQPARSPCSCLDFIIPLCQSLLVSHVFQLPIFRYFELPSTHCGFWLPCVFCRSFWVERSCIPSFGVHRCHCCIITITVGFWLLPPGSRVTP